MPLQPNGRNGYTITNTPKIYSCILEGQGVSGDPPIVYIQQNTIGNIVWTRQGAGVAKGTLTNGFPYEKTTIMVTNDYGTSTNIIGLAYYETVNAISVRCLQPDGTSGSNDDYRLFVNITIYP